MIARRPGPSDITGPTSSRRASEIAGPQPSRISIPRGRLQGGIPGRDAASESSEHHSGDVRERLDGNVSSGPVFVMQGDRVPLNCDSFARPCQRRRIHALFGAPGHELIPLLDGRRVEVVASHRRKDGSRSPDSTAPRPERPRPRPRPLSRNARQRRRCSGHHLGVGGRWSFADFAERERRRTRVGLTSSRRRRPHTRIRHSRQRQPITNARDRRLRAQGDPVPHFVDVRPEHFVVATASVVDPASDS